MTFLFLKSEQLQGILRDVEVTFDPQLGELDLMNLDGFDHEMNHLSRGGALIVSVHI